MQSILIKPVTEYEIAAIKMLYQAVAKTEGGLARTWEEITDDYVSHNVVSSLDRGIGLVAQIDGEIVGEIHAYRPIPKVFKHVLSDLTIAVHPAYQGKGIGRSLFEVLLENVKTHHPGILRVELIARESNQKAIQFYQSLGFSIEGKMTARIRSAGGGFEADIPMAWLRA
jgi:putative acetyltransferase